MKKNALLPYKKTISSSNGLTCKVYVKTDSQGVKHF